MTPDKKCADLLDRARALMIVNHPFFASVILRNPIKWDDQAVPTAGVTPRGTIYLNPNFCRELSVQNMIFLLAHEAMHYMGLHALRRAFRDHKKWNWSNDAVINETLKKSGVGEFIEGGVERKGAEAEHSEGIYASLGEDETPDFDLNGDIMPGDPNDPNDKPVQSMTDAEKSELEVSVKMAVVQAERSTKMRGKSIPDAVQRIIDDIVKVRTPWHDILERYMTSYVNDETSWSRANKRFMHMNMFMPGKNRVPEMGDVVVAIDTSGSVSQEDLRHFLSHAIRIFEDCNPQQIHIVYCDSDVRETYTFQRGDDIDAPAVGGGGTRFKPVFDWVEEQSIDPDVLVYITDLCGDTNFDAPDYHTIWLSTYGTEVPFGEVIKYEVV